MVRKALGTVLALLLLFTGAAQTSPVDGPYREQSAGRKRKVLEERGKVRFQCRFVGNERACVIVKGDHDPVMDLVVKVFDRQGKLIAQDNGGDVLAVIWYPPRSEDYFIEINQDPADKTAFKDGYNALYIAVK
jgi:hypothetical protein